MAYELGIIGAGNMAEAIVRGVLRRGLVQREKLIAVDISPARRTLFENELGVKAVGDIAQVAGQSQVVLLSVKPQQAADTVAAVGRVMDPSSLTISIMAGISSTFIEKRLGAARPWRVVRTMPNTPMLVGEGMVGLAAGQHATPQDMEYARRLFETAATVVEVGEQQLDAVTAVSGSGPAYFFYFVEHLIRAGESLGLTADQARQLAIKTATGAAKMLADSTDSPQELRRKVTSPGGTTQAAIAYLESQNAGDIFSRAVNLAAQRSKELGV